MDRCKGGYEYTLIICDHFTRFLQIYPTKNKSAKAAAEQIFNKFILNFGFPRRIHYDQGKEFNNNLFYRLHKLTGIASSRTTPYHPMGDGQPERMNRTLINMLKCLSAEGKTRWKEHLAKLAFVYNSTINKATGFSPFRLMFGWESRLPIDMMFGIDFGKKHGTYSEFVKDWETGMKQAVEIARKHINAAKTWNERLYNKKVKGTEIVLGDNVLQRNHKERGGTGKLRSYWEDEIYQVVEVDPQLPLITIKPVRGSCTRKVHRNNIMKCNDLLPEKPIVPKRIKEKTQRVIPREDSGDIQNDRENSVMEEVDEGEVSGSGNPSSDSLDEEIIRRSTRIRNALKILTYDVIGGNPVVGKR